MVLNLAPVGCYPAFLVQLPHDSSDLDEFGCMVSYNNAVVDYNNMVKETLTQTRESLSDASVIYVDTYTVLLELFQHPTFHGSYTSPWPCLIIQKTLFDILVRHSSEINMTPFIGCYKLV